MCSDNINDQLMSVLQLFVTFVKGTMACDNNLTITNFLECIDTVSTLKHFLFLGENVDFSDNYEEINNICQYKLVRSTGLSSLT